MSTTKPQTTGILHGTTLLSDYLNQQVSQVVSPDKYMQTASSTAAAFQMAADEAYASGKTLYADGVYTFDSGFTSFVGADFSKATFHVSSSWDGATSRYLMHLLHPDNTTQELSVSVATGGADIPALSSFTNHCVHVQSKTEVGYIRTGNNILKQEVYHIISGKSQGYKSNIDINSVSVVKATPLDVNPVVVKLPRVIFDSIPAVPLNHVFRIDRAFVGVIGGSYNTHDMSVSANRQAFNAFVQMTSVCYRVAVFNVQGYGFFKNASDGFSYTVNLSGLYPSVEGCSDPENWGLVDGTLFKGGLIRRCHGARMGAHEDATDLTIEDCTAYTRGFMLGSGYGTLVMRDCVFRMTEPQNMLEFRYDYGNCWKGDILIDNPTVHLCPDIPAFTALVKFQVALNSGIYLSSNVTAYTCNTLTIRNPNIISNTNQTNAYEMWNVASDFSQNVSMPDRVVIENINTMSPVASYVKVGTSGSYFSSNSRMIAKTTEVIVRGYRVADPANNLQITPRISDADKGGMRNSFRWKYRDVTGLAINASLPSTTQIEIDDCTVYRLDNASISGMTDLSKIKVTDCDFTDTIQCRTNGGQIELCNVRFTVLGTVALNGVIKSIGTTIVAGSTITGQTSLTAAILMSYRDATLFA